MNKCPKCCDPSPWHRDTCDRLTDYYATLGYLRAKGLDEARAHCLAEEAMSQITQEDGVMSRHAKKMRRIEEWEGTFPDIDLCREHSGAWLYWAYCIVSDERRAEMRVEIPLEEETTPWLYVNGDPLIPETKLTWEEAEARYEAKTRLRLLETHRAAILANEAEGLETLREAATAMGLYGQLEGQIRRTS